MFSKLFKKNRVVAGYAVSAKYLGVTQVRFVKTILEAHSLYNSFIEFGGEPTITELWDPKYVKERIH